jgi:hypothetical protein
MKIYIIGPEFKIATLQYELKILYMIVNFRARGISRGTRKLAWMPTLNKKKKIYRLIARWISNITAFYSEGFNCRRKKIKRFISILAGHA